jgi:hypothetical protein
MPLLTMERRTLERRTMERRTRRAGSLFSYGVGEEEGIE